MHGCFFEADSYIVLLTTLTESGDSGLKHQVWYWVGAAMDAKVCVLRAYMTLFVLPNPFFISNSFL